METAVTPPPEADLHLLTDWSEPGRNARIGRSAILSVVTHVAAIIFLLVMPETLMQPPRPKEKAAVVTPLIFTPLTLTQREPNPTKTVREFRSPDLTPRIKSPVSPSPEPQAAAPKKADTPAPPPAPKAAAQNPLPEPPKVEISPTEPKLTLPVQQQAQVAPPRQASPFEDLQSANGVSAGQGVKDLKDLAPNNGRGGVPSGAGGINSQGTAPLASSGAELPRLLSDPKGVDFTQYLAQVLASVKRAWSVIMPKNGHRGYVSVQFSIHRDGTIGKMAFAEQTGDSSLDNASVMAISSAGPFGPLPVQYTDGEIHVQMNFAYNQPRR
jgi:TonB family protein